MLNAGTLNNINSINKINDELSLQIKRLVVIRYENNNLHEDTKANIKNNIYVYDEMIKLCEKAQGILIPFLTKGSGLTKSREKWNDIYNDFANKQKDYEKEKQELMKLL